MNDDTAELELELVPFGDSEPEDAWQADDPLEVLLDNLARRFRRWFGILVVLDGKPIHAELVRRWEALNVLEHELERRDLEPEFELRRSMIRDDLEHVRRRLEAVADG